MLAGVGIVGIIIGLAVQDALKDMIRGISIISENYYKILRKEFENHLKIKEKKKI